MDTEFWNEESTKATHPAVWFMVFDANIFSVISFRSVLSVEETRVSGKKHRALSHIASSTLRHEQGSKTQHIQRQDCYLPLYKKYPSPPPPPCQGQTCNLVSRMPHDRWIKKSYDDMDRLLGRRHPFFRLPLLAMCYLPLWVSCFMFFCHIQHFKDISCRSYLKGKRGDNQKSLKNWHVKRPVKGGSLET